MRDRVCEGVSRTSVSLYPRSHKVVRQLRDKSLMNTIKAELKIAWYAHKMTVLLY